MTQVQDIAPLIPWQPDTFMCHAIDCQQPDRHHCRRIGGALEDQDGYQFCSEICRKRGRMGDVEIALSISGCADQELANARELLRLADDVAHRALFHRRMSMLYMLLAMTALAVQTWRA